MKTNQYHHLSAFCDGKRQRNNKPAFCAGIFYEEELYSNFNCITTGYGIILSAIELFTDLNKNAVNLYFLARLLLGR